jgi:hypothetical protein
MGPILGPSLEDAGLTTVNGVIVAATAVGAVASGAASDAASAVGSFAHFCAKKVTKKSGKERASDIPSWAKRYGSELKPIGDETPTDVAERIMDARYGQGMWTRSGQ